MAKKSKKGKKTKKGKKKKKSIRKSKKSISTRELGEVQSKKKKSKRSIRKSRKSIKSLKSKRSSKSKRSIKSKKSRKKLRKTSSKEVTEDTEEQNEPPKDLTEEELLIIEASQYKEGKMAEYFDVQRRVRIKSKDYARLKREVEGIEDDRLIEKDPDLREMETELIQLETDAIALLNDAILEAETEAQKDDYLKKIDSSEYTIIDIKEYQMSRLTKMIDMKLEGLQGYARKEKYFESIEKFHDQIVELRHHVESYDLARIARLTERVELARIQIQSATEEEALELNNKIDAELKRIEIAEDDMIKLEETEVHRVQKDIHDISQALDGEDDKALADHLIEKLKATLDEDENNLYLVEDERICRLRTDIEQSTKELQRAIAREDQADIARLQYKLQQDAIHLRDAEDHIVEVEKYQIDHFQEIQKKEREQLQKATTEAEKENFRQQICEAQEGHEQAVSKIHEVQQRRIDHLDDIMGKHYTLLTRAKEKDNLQSIEKLEEIIEKVEMKLEEEENKVFNLQEDHVRSLINELETCTEEFNAGGLTQLVKKIQTALISAENRVVAMNQNKIQRINHMVQEQYQILDRAKRGGDFRKCDELESAIMDAEHRMERSEERIFKLEEARRERLAKRKDIQAVSQIKNSTEKILEVGKERLRRITSMLRREERKFREAQDEGNEARVQYLSDEKARKMDLVEKIKEKLDQMAKEAAEAPATPVSTAINASTNSIPDVRASANRAVKGESPGCC